MNTAAEAQATGDFAFEERTLRKAFVRIVLFVFVLSMFNQADRMISFASLTMNRDLKLTATTYGLANSMFAAGYVIFQIPALMLQTRFGARKWLAFIVIACGLCTLALASVTGIKELYPVRFVQGIVEAGLIPGVVLYFTYWFPPSFRGRATSVFFAAQTVTFTVIAPVSGLILDSHGLLGLSGWRLLFVVEGIPTVALGIIAYFYLVDGPEQARWLSDSERVALKARLQREGTTTTPVARTSHPKAWGELFSRVPLLLALGYFAIITAQSSTGYWGAQIMREVTMGHSFLYVGILLAIPYICTMIAQPSWGAHSDRKMERNWHAIGAFSLGILGWVIVGFGHTPVSRLAGFVCAIVGDYAGQGIFWTIPPRALSPVARPVGISFINMVGMLGSVTSPIVVGFLRDRTHSFTPGLLYVAAMLVMCCVVMLLIRADERKPAAS